VLRTIARRVLRLIPVLFLVSLATFSLTEFIPGDPAVAALGPEASPEALERAREELGLNDPIPQRYADWLGNALRGDLGNSLLRPADSVTDLLRESFPITLELALLGLVFALAGAIPIAIWSAYRAGAPFDRSTNALTSALISIPSFLAGLILIFFFVFNNDAPRFVVLVGGLAGALALGVSAYRRYGDDTDAAVVVRAAAAVVVAVVTVWLVARFPTFPRRGFVRITSDAGIGANLRSAFLPALTLALTELAVFTRLLRTDMITTLQEDFILAARAKGMPIGHILWRDALRPSSFSLITLAGVSLGRLIGGTVIVETIFGIPGVGRLVVQQGVILGDITILQGGVLVIAVFYVTINLIVDLSYAYLDPRIRRG
jgi:peptide/nickel transport system permease protein